MQWDNILIYLLILLQQPVVPAIKKGFLSNSKGAIYGDKLTTLRKKGTPEAATRTGAGISLVDQPTTGGMDNLNVPSSSTAAKTKSSAGGLIQEVKKGDKATSAPAAAVAPAPKPSATSVGGLTAVSTTKRVAPIVPAKLDPAPPLSPSGRRAEAVTSPSGSETMETEASSFISSAGPVAVDLGDGIEQPKFTMKERGVVSMGDFENMNTSARSNRLVLFLS